MSVYIHTHTTINIMHDVTIFTNSHFWHCNGIVFQNVHFETLF